MKSTSEPKDVVCFVVSNGTGVAQADSCYHWVTQSTSRPR